MKYRTFEELPVWQDAVRLYELIEVLLQNPGFQISRALRDQLDRAVLSISNNIAEGFERGTTNELLHFLYIARGSAGETRSMLRICARRPANSKQNQNLDETISLAISCSKQLRAWAEALQNSNIEGPRYFSDKTRAQYEDDKRAEECRKKLLRMLPPTNPFRKEAEERGLI